MGSRACYEGHARDEEEGCHAGNEGHARYEEEGCHAVNESYEGSRACYEGHARDEEEGCHAGNESHGCYEGDESYEEVSLTKSTQSMHCRESEHANILNGRSFMTRLIRP